MSTTVSGALTRVFLITPRGRVHLAIPSDIPFADMLPTLLHYAGENLADEGAARGGWVLTRLGGLPIDPSRTPAQLQILDGDLLQFTPRAATPPPPVFDDLADAVATATRQRPGQWQVSTTRRFAVGVSAAALIGGAAAILFAGPPSPVAAVVGLVVGLVLLGVAALTSRAAGDGTAGILLGLVSLFYAGVGGLLLGGERDLRELASSHALFAAAAVVVYSSLAMTAIGTGRFIFLSSSIAGTALGLGAATCLLFGVTAAGAAAVIASISFATLPVLTMFAYRMAGLRVPSVPTSPEDVKNDNETIDGPTVLSRSNRAAYLLTGLLAAVGLIVGASALIIAVDDGFPGILLDTVLGLCLMLRARPLRDRAQRLTLLLPGVAALGFAAVAFYLNADSTIRLTVPVAVFALVALISLVYGFAVAGRRISPVWGRLLDIVDVILIVAIVPLALWVCGLYSWIGSLRL